MPDNKKAEQPKAKRRQLTAAEKIERLKAEIAETEAKARAQAQAKLAAAVERRQATAKRLATAQKAHDEATAKVAELEATIAGETDSQDTES